MDDGDSHTLTQRAVIDEESPLLYLSYFELDETRYGEFLACLWQGRLPSGLRLHKWLYLAGEPQRRVLIWEAADDEAVSWVERTFGGYGALATEQVAEDATEGMAAAWARDLEGFGGWLRDRGADEEAVVRALDVRRRGTEAADLEAAAGAGRAWASGA